MILDLHVHTTRAGAHSELRPDQLAAEVRRLGLSAALVTEHDRVWDRWDARAAADTHEMPWLVGMEVSTDLGHIAAYGLDQYIGGIYKAETLRKVVADHGGFLIALHPFRHKLNPRGGTPLTFDEAITWPVFQLVDAIEVLNGGNTPEENALAIRVAEHLEMPMTGGSDAHSLNGLGYHVTLFEREVGTSAELLAELKAHRFRAATGLLTGQLVDTAGRPIKLNSAA